MKDNTTSGHECVAEVVFICKNVEPAHFSSHNPHDNEFHTEFVIES